MIGTQIKNLLIKKGITAKALSKELGFSENVITNYINGHSTPNIDTVLKLANYFNVSTDYLIGNETLEAIVIQKDKINKLSSEQKTTIILKILEIIQNEK